MAYRFLLQVPESLAAEASMAVNAASDAQVVVVRDAGGRGVDDPYVDLTVAAHTLRVVQSVYEWFDELGASRPDIGIVLHSGQRVRLETFDRSGLVAAIRRDQPWVERTIPKIGEHESEAFAGVDREQWVSDADPTPYAATSALERSWANLPALQEPAGGRTVAIRELNHVAIRVTDLEKAERFYSGFLSMDIVGRARRSTDGGFAALPASYAWAEATPAGREADVTFLRNGPLVLALQRLGRGARLDRGQLDHISIRVDATTFTNLKGQVLIRSMELVATAETAFAFRDPQGITWEVTLQSVPEFM